MSQDKEILLTKEEDGVSLQLVKDGEHVDEPIQMSMDLARSLRSSLEAVLAGRRKSVLATYRKRQGGQWPDLSSSQEDFPAQGRRRRQSG